MAERRSNFLRSILSALTIAYCRAVGALPIGLSRRIGRATGLAAYYLVPRVRSVSLENIERAYGDTLPRSEKRRIARESAMNVGIVAAEFTRIAQLKGEFLQRQVSFKGLDNLNPGQGACMIGAHIGNWEWMAASFRDADISLAEIVRPLDDPRLAAFVNGTRTSSGVTTVPKSGAWPEIVRLLREGHNVGVLIDQQPRESAVPVTFFGHPCWGTIAPALAALREKVPIHLICMVRNADDGYTLSIDPAIEIERTGDLRTDILTVSQRCQDTIEAFIREHPEQWLWAHRRWKRRERLEREWEKRQQAKSESTNVESR